MDRACAQRMQTPSTIPNEASAAAARGMRGSVTAAAEASSNPTAVIGDIEGRAIKKLVSAGMPANQPMRAQLAMIAAMAASAV